MAYKDVNLKSGARIEEDYENLETILESTAGQSMIDNESTAASIYETIHTIQPEKPGDTDTNESVCKCSHQTETTNV